jgi:hypothetical protein
MIIIIKLAVPGGAVHRCWGQQHWRTGMSICSSTGTATVAQQQQQQKKN